MNRGTKRVEFLTFSLLLLFFVGVSFGVVTLGAKVYKQIEADANNHFELRTPMTYLMMKIRQNDRVDGISSEQIEGIPALVLREYGEDIIYETWIYVYEDALREVYIEQGDSFNLVDGDVVMPLKGMEVTLNQNGQVAIEVTTIQGEMIQAKVALQAYAEEENHEKTHK